MDEFTKIVEEVSDDGYVDADLKEYPLIDQGSYPATCIEVRKVDDPYKQAKPGSQVLKLLFELDETYEDAQGETKKFHLYSKPFRFFFGEKASLYQLCLSLTGQLPVFSLVATAEGPKRRFKYDQFLHMKCNIFVKHRAHEGRMYANIVDYATNAEQRAHNCSLLPT
ncbi:hypothetical protein HYW32_01155 [Candidatus Berkelbacteria bacterium]|nr:hypothetical protein [Candidatus Berkelbacteria bacterium]